MPELDSPWKEALDDFLQPFLSMFAPSLEMRIDWDMLPEALDGELAKLFPDTPSGKGFVDRLYKVRLCDGSFRWILIHIEVQSQHDEKFPERVYRYFYRLQDKFDLPVTCLIVLADESPSWRPSEYLYEFEGTRLHFTFPVVKLTDYQSRIEELERSDNLFALIVLAHLQTQRVHDHEGRLDWKRRITHNLFERDLDGEIRARVLRLVDWLIDLPIEWNDIYWNEIREWKERNIMPFVSIFERKAAEAAAETAMEKGMEKGRYVELLAGLEVALDIKFGELAKGLYEQLTHVTDLAKLKAVQRAIRSAASPDELRQLL